MSLTNVPTQTNLPTYGYACHEEGSDAGRALASIEALARSAAAADERSAALFETFRRALVEHDERAWEYIFTTFRPMIIYWARRSGAIDQQHAEDFVNAAFLRFIRAITPEKFASFANAAALLGYLQRCTSGAVIDDARAVARNCVLDEHTAAEKLIDPLDSDDDLLARMSANDAWHYISMQLRNEEERAVFHCSFVLGMRPAEIYERRPDLFASIQHVYETKRTMLERLRRDRTLQKMVM